VNDTSGCVGVSEMIIGRLWLVADASAVTCHVEEMVGHQCDDMFSSTAVDRHSVGFLNADS
jgi:hypothetical protein